MIREVSLKRQKPKVFILPDHEKIVESLVSLMMPFEKSFDGVLQAVSEVCAQKHFTCRRADNFWEQDLILQDIVTLIDKSRIVICDCTGRNPNVFYEIGIAHTLGRDVILITQNNEDVPFDLRHLLYIRNV